MIFVINFGTAFIWGWVGRAVHGEVGGSKVKEESETIQVIEFRMVMKSISSCVVISSYCYSWPVSTIRLIINYTYVAVMRVTEQYQVSTTILESSISTISPVMNIHGL